MAEQKDKYVNVTFTNGITVMFYAIYLERIKKVCEDLGLNYQDYASFRQAEEMNSKIVFTSKILQL